MCRTFYKQSVEQSEVGKLCVHPTWFIWDGDFILIFFPWQSSWIFFITVHILYYIIYIYIYITGLWSSSYQSQLEVNRRYRRRLVHRLPVSTLPCPPWLQGALSQILLILNHVSKSHQIWNCTFSGQLKIYIPSAKLIKWTEICVPHTNSELWNESVTCLKNISGWNLNLNQEQRHIPHHLTGCQ